MNANLTRIGSWLAARAENISALMLGSMFAAFLIQIAFRYLFNLPTGWTHELTVMLWLWLVLWGAAFVVSEREEIRFDIIYGAVSTRTRRFMVIVSGVALIAVYAISFPAVLSYVTFMKVQSTAYLKVRFDLLFSIYIVFAFATIARYFWLTWQAMRGVTPGTSDRAEPGSGL